MNKLCYLALVAFLLSQNIVNAAPASQENTVELSQQPSSNWSGFYLGINSGYTWGNAHAKTTASNPPSSGYFTQADIQSINANGNFHLHPQGYVGGAQVGYNKCFTNAITLGIETDFNAFLLSTSKSVSAFYPEAGAGEYTLTQKVSTDWLYTLRPRIGYAYKKAFAFLTGGLALTNLKYTQVFFDNSLSAQGYSPSLDAYTTASTNKVSAGWAIGAGVEYLLCKRLSICLSYLYASFNSLSNSDNIRLDFQSTIYRSSLNNSANLNTNIVRVGLNWKLYRE
ncbi:MAG: outer membrane beta-barrel protein [Simkaniaceae bacterium]|nr:outer membrane beta-barrel protein [Simkaniaceae bacterium]